MVDEKDFISFLTVKAGLSQRSVSHCVVRLRRIKKYLAPKGLEFTPLTVEQFFFDQKHRGLSSASLNSYLFVFKYIEKYFQDRGRDVSFMKSFEAFRQVRVNPIEVLTQEQVENLLSVSLKYKKYNGKDTSILDTIYSTLTMALCYTGARFDEMISLKVRHVNIAHGKITFPAATVKNKESRSVFITEPLVSKLALLVQNKKPDDLVFTNFVGGKVRQSDYSSDLQRRKTAAGIPGRCHPHLLRHTYATHLYMTSRDIGLVQLVLGHKDISSTMIYVHLADDVIKQGMYSHPFIRRYVDAKETIKNIEQMLYRLKLEDDKRFDFGKTKHAVVSFITSLHDALS